MESQQRDNDRKELETPTRSGRQHPVRLGFHSNNRHGLEGLSRKGRRASSSAFLPPAHHSARNGVVGNLSKEFPMSFKWVTVYDPSLPGVSEAIEINPEHLKKLATWMCEMVCHHPRLAVRDELESNEGFCDDCRDKAGFMLVDCPWIDMNRPEPTA